MKRKPLREQLREQQVETAIQRDIAAEMRARVAKLEALVLAYKRFALKVCLQRDIKHDAPPSSHAMAEKDALEAGAEVERLSRELWPEVYARLDEKIAERQTERSETLERKEPGKWN